MRVKTNRFLKSMLEPLSIRVRGVSDEVLPTILNFNTPNEVKYGIVQRYRMTRASRQFDENLLNHENIFMVHFYPKNIEVKETYEIIRRSDGFMDSDLTPQDLQSEGGDPTSRRNKLIDTYGGVLTVLSVQNRPTRQRILCEYNFIN